MTGILLIACGHPYYTHMACNLAVSIKYHDKDIPITLAHNGNGLEFLFDEQKKVFDKIIPLPDDYITHNGSRQYIKSKMYVYDLSPYDNTLFLDADMIWSTAKKPSELFAKLKGRGIQFAVRGENPEKLKSEWVNLEEVKKEYGYQHWYELSSEFIYFEKSKEVKKFFDTAKKMYGKAKVNVQAFAGGYPDEVFYSLACEQLGVNMECPFLPSYWQPFYFNKIMPEKDIRNNFYTISAGGAFMQSNIKRIYNNITSHCFSVMGIGRQPYQLTHKARILPERSKI